MSWFTIAAPPFLLSALLMRSTYSQILHNREVNKLNKVMNTSTNILNTEEFRNEIKPIALEIKEKSDVYSKIKMEATERVGIFENAPTEKLPLNTLDPDPDLDKMMEETLPMMEKSKHFKSPKASRKSQTVNYRDFIKKFPDDNDSTILEDKTMIDKIMNSKIRKDKP
jgi:hypothetical protein